MWSILRSLGIKVKSSPYCPVLLTCTEANVDPESCDNNMAAKSAFELHQSADLMLCDLSLRLRGQGERVVGGSRETGLEGVWGVAVIHSRPGRDWSAWPHTEGIARSSFSLDAVLRENTSPPRPSITSSNGKGCCECYAP